MSVWRRSTRRPGPPRRTLACHCTFCQRFTGGGAYLVESLYFRENVGFSGLTLSEYSHRSDRSGRHLTPQFCPRCGTTVGLTLEWNPRTQSILAGCFDDPGSVAPDLHIFTGSARPETWLPHDVPCYRMHYLGDDLLPDPKVRPVEAGAPWRVAMLDSGNGPVEG